MKNKVINLFGDKGIVENQAVKYAQLLEQLLLPFESDFDDVEFYEDVIEFVIMAWNFGNMKNILPQGESDAVVNAIEDKDINVDLLKRMIAFKIEKFKEYPNFIVDYEVEESDGQPLLAVVIQSPDDYMDAMSEDMDYDHSEGDFEENYIDRQAIILKPLQPFLDWFGNLYPDLAEDSDESMTYLVGEDINDVQAWLKKNFDKLFIHELEDWHTNKKEWPQQRTYKMFKQWFQVDISTMVYDLEKDPVFKD